MLSWTTMTITLLVLSVISAGATVAIQIKTASPVKTSNHTVEHYHGNWWATWHSPSASRAIMVTAVTAFAALALATLAGVVVVFNA